MPQITITYLLHMESSLIKHIRSGTVNSTVAFSLKCFLLLVHGFLLWSFSSCVGFTFSKDHVVCLVYYRVSAVT
jgi:hypothetical protein